MFYKIFYSICRRAEPSDDTEEYSVKSEFHITLPESLKLLLMDEHDAVIKQKKLPSLPMSITVDKIMEEYKEAIESGKFPGLHK